VGVGGIIFFGTGDLDKTVSFYENTLGFTPWLDQLDCRILRRGNLLLGFCRRPQVDVAGIITVLAEDRAGVDALYEKLSDVAESEPREVSRYRIYRFFARDPEGRHVECQAFLDPLPPLPHLD
jgi:catechol 2,3-dioxygenase-like lactoylglutathione lyase family enzyme